MNVTSLQTQTLLTAIVLIHGAGVLVWLGMALAARLTPKASYTMAACNLASALALALHAMRGRWPDALTYTGADLLALACFALLRAAVPAIETRALAWRSALAVWGLAAVVMLAGGRAWGEPLVCAGAAVLALMACHDAWRRLRANTSLLNTLLLSLPPMLIAALTGLRLAHSLVAPSQGAWLLEPTAFNVAFLWGGIVLVLAENATMAFLSLMRLVARIQRLTLRDPLTDTLNRRAFGQTLEQAHAWRARGRSYTLVMMDMDRFKQLNDTLGHAAGDAALLQLVREIQPCLREVDALGRLGGEEFGVLLPSTDIAGAALVAERMRALLEAAPLRWQGRDWPLSASFGIAEAEGGDATGEDVLARADAALYRAKAQGRNLVQA